MKRILGLVVISLALGSLAADNDPTKVLTPGQKPEDTRLRKVRTLNDKDFFLTPPARREAWEARRRDLRAQVLVATGLWPLPEKTPLAPVIHGKIDREEYTIEKVFFASYPGHYVSGNLYRPRARTGKLPGVLCPHGHWRDGRFFDAGESAAREQVAKGAEKTLAGGRYPLQARCAQLARLGCIVFHYDMVGVADSTAIGHTQGFTDAEAELRLQSFMGLQTWNSMRALDFLLSLPEVDPGRIGVTGASGGGTQTFILCALDDRPAAAFPAVMVSTAMQGGCICENCSYLRQGTGNIELAGLFAPRPLGMTGANDWTLDIERKGLPELKALYRLYGAEDRVLARCFPQFEHNYNQVSREVMYNWFNKHLKLGQPEPVVEKPFEPVPPRELSVYDDAHPRPGDTKSSAELRKYLTEESERQLAGLRPRGPDGFKEYRRVLGTALRVMAGDELPPREDIEPKLVGRSKDKSGEWQRLLLGRKDQGEQVPAVWLRGPSFNGTVVVWVHPAGKASLWRDGKPTPAAQQVLDRKAGILSVDVFGTGELALDRPPAVDARYAGYTFGYNRPLLAQRIHDVLTAVGFARGLEGATKVDLVGWDRAGPWVLLARGLCGKVVARTVSDADTFRFENVREVGDEMMLPGALKYGGLPALAGLAAPGELLLHNHRGTGLGQWLPPVYQAAGAEEKLERVPEKLTEERVVEWVLR